MDTRQSVARRAATASVVFFCLFMVVGLAAVYGLTSSIDTSLMLEVHAWTSPELTAAMRTITDAGTILVVGPICLVEAVIFYRCGFRVLALVLVLEVALDPMLANGMKLLFMRPRPTVFPHLVPASGYSYPSGHVALAMAGYGFSAVLIAPRVRVIAGRILVVVAAAIVIVLVAISRVYLGVHYPSDTVGSVLLVSAWISFWLVVIACRESEDSSRAEPGPSSAG